METQVIIVPYDSGHRDVRMGAGPMRLLDSAIKPLLQNRPTPFDVVTVETATRWDAEIATIFELNRNIATHVRAATVAGKFPLVLSGNCNPSLGTLSGLGGGPLGVIWFDAHGDFNTPDTSPSGFFDGMGLAVAAGLCWKDLAASIPGFRPTASENILHVGARELDAAERRNMETAGVEMLTAAAFAPADFAAALQRLRARTPDVYLHLDVDVLDRAELHANEFSPPGGFRVATVAEALRLVAEMFTIRAMGIASYDPAVDPEGRAASAVTTLLETSVFPR